jgi:hypothetical protein
MKSLNHEHTNKYEYLGATLRSAQGRAIRSNVLIPLRSIPRISASIPSAWQTAASSSITMRVSASEVFIRELTQTEFFITKEV